MANAISLDSLRDVHLPPPLGWWEQAPGWYLLIVLILMTIIVVLICFTRYYQSGHVKREALALLKQYHQAYTVSCNSCLTCAQISELLKRVALTYYPREQVSGLQGEAWLDFLNTHVKNTHFNCVRVLLLERPFQHSNQTKSDTDNLEPLFECARIWIKSQGKPCLN